jgi:glycosyltransferase involved in cell wall biosynthesis
MFVTSPFKTPTIQSMVKEFSGEIVSRIVTPAYPLTRAAESHRSFGNRAYDQLFGGRDFENEITRFEPDIVYSDSAYYGTQFKISAFPRHMKVPLVVHLLGDWWREYWTWFSVADWRHRTMGTQRYLYNWSSMILAGRVMPVCRWLERVVRYHLPRKRTEVVYMGTDPKQFFAEPGMELQKPAVAIIQNHTVYSKVAGLIRFSKIAERLSNVHFFIAEGERVDQPYLQIIKNHYAGLRNVHFLPGIDSPIKVRQMLTAADCYVLASELDCCPTTVLEASLVGRPVIASRVGGVPEIVFENETGWTIPNESVDDWVEKISLVISDQRLNRKLGQQGRNFVTERFSWKKIATQVEQLVFDEIS